MTIASDFKWRIEDIIADLDNLPEGERDENERRYITSSLEVLRVYLADLSTVCEHYTPLGFKRVLGKLSSVNKGVIETGARWPENRLDIADKVMHLSNDAFSARREISGTDSSAFKP